ncbi:branched-chain amino acid ABC transporter substrate-binding protein [Limnohabitans sp. T6-5]|uniref:branched-chain amino acid ABC transporter substrate-binding protein n=1 Tax=Limnohabitans sp. T6-5 TaxID=1100724 RepID=UPI001E3709F1|nr:branched-chain amino acid ABC transporter substrate-binding protein [Limnohabitans sp. T6-5]
MNSLTSRFTSSRTLWLATWTVAAAVAAQAATPASPAVKSSAANATAKSGNTLQVAVVSVADDARYQPRRAERRWPGHSTGRLLSAARLAVDDAQVELQEAGLSLRLREAVAADADQLAATLQQLQTDKVAYWLLDLPDALMPQAVQAAQKAGALAINASSPLDSLRSQSCGASAVLHSYPSQSMLADALAQFLAARSWREVLVLQGSSPADQLQLQAWQRASKRYGLKTTDTKTFKLSGDPRERDAANPKLLTAERKHEVVAVWDAEGEFARSLVYATQWPRPVLGSSGLTALAWHAQWERYGGPQLNRRFVKLTQRPMTGQDWAAWVGVKSLVTAWVAEPKGTPQTLAARLRTGQVQVDGFKGQSLSYRAWDGQLRQPVLLAHADGVVQTAPMEGVLHPIDTLDTLGVDDKESPCKTR